MENIKKVKTDELDKIMSLSHEHVGPKILAKIKIYVLIRAELLFPLCYEIPCTTERKYIEIIETNEGS